MRGIDDPLTVITASLLCSVSTGSGGLFSGGGVPLLASVADEGCAGVACVSPVEGCASGILSFSSVHGVAGAAGRRASTRLRCSRPASVN